MNTITIEFDTEKKTINKIEGMENVNPLDASKILFSVALQCLNKIDFKPKGKIIVPEKKIIGGE